MAQRSECSLLVAQFHGTHYTIYRVCEKVSSCADRRCLCICSPARVSLDVLLCSNQHAGGSHQLIAVLGNIFAVNKCENAIMGWGLSPSVRAPAIKAGAFGSASAAQLHACLICRLASHNRHIERGHQTILKWQDFLRWVLATKSRYMARVTSYGTRLHPLHGVCGQPGCLVIL